MKRSELTIFAVLAVIGMVIAFWLLVISPKRQEAASLKTDVDQLQASLDQAQQTTASGQQAKESFPTDYRRLVVLGKAAPEDGEQASLLVQLQRLADLSKVQFQSIDLSASSSTATTPAAPAPSTSSESSSTSTSSSSSSSSGDLASAPPAESTGIATEAAAATLPIGASIGPAGLPPSTDWRSRRSSR